MSNVSLETIQQMINGVFHSYQEAVTLLRDVAEGHASQDDVRAFLRGVGVSVEGDVQIQASIKDRVLRWLDREDPPGLIKDREWNSDVKAALRAEVDQMVPETLTVILQGPPYQLLRSVLLALEHGRNTGFGRGASVTHKERGICSELLSALWKEFGK